MCILLHSRYICLCFLQYITCAVNYTSTSEHITKLQVQTTVVTLIVQTIKLLK